MQTILLQDEPALFRGLEQSLVRRAGIRLLTAAADSDLLELCRRHRPDLVLLCSEDPDPPLARRLRTEPEAPICLVATDGADALRALEEARRRLGLPARNAPRCCCHLRASVDSAAGTTEGRTRDLSASGVFVALDPGRITQDEVTVRLRRPGARSGHAARGRIVRRVKADPEGVRLAGVAICFREEARLSAEDVAGLAGAGSPD